ncbi:hypothetical protein [Stenotrophomonas indicatrix]|uniref:hypothetical protein n=1 Tax=Stenotrophomonas indicatrix TaxID=2045451 RepID=UPI001CBF2DE4|nr:hypothetical protein [Stenotrophomonas indicatrix]
MSDAYEVVMEGVPLDGVLAVLARIWRSSDSVSVPEVDGMPVDVEMWIDAGPGSACADGDSCLVQTLQGFNVGNVHLPFLLLRVLRYDGLMDVEVSFDADRAEVLAAMDELQKLFLYIKGVVGARTVIGGMEPAKDEETRFFTDEFPGPMAS